EGRYGDPNVTLEVQEWEVSFPGARFLAVDSEFIDSGLQAIQNISFNQPRCGNGQPAVCVNDDIAGIGQRAKLFTRGKDITPYSPLELPTGQAGDQGIFKFAKTDPQRSAQTGATFTLSQLLYHQGNAANDNNLDKVEGVVPLTETDILELVGKTHCALVFKSDISDTGTINGQKTASLKGGTKGITAFKVTSARANPSGGSYLPLLTLELVPSSQVSLVCDAATQPPPPPPPPGIACAGIPLTYGPPSCAPCPYDSERLCAFKDLNTNGSPDAGEGPAWGAALPAANRGFDDPQADPDPTFRLNKIVKIRYTRGDLWNLPPSYAADDSGTGNPPWGSQPGDGDADTQPDSVPDRNNRGMFASAFEVDKAALNQQQPNDAIGEASCGAAVTCDPYTQDCGGFSRYADAAPSGFDPYPGSLADPLNEAYWPVVPFPREWIATDTPSLPAAKRLLRPVSSVVSYDPTLPATQAYELEESAKNVVMTAPGSPIAGALRDAYKYFVETVFRQTDDPSINCRNYKIVIVTDGLDACGADPCSGGPTGGGPAQDLAELVLPESAAGLRNQANQSDPRIRTQGIPVYVVALGLDQNDPKLTCMTRNNTNGQVFAANDREGLRAALESIFEYRTRANFVAGLNLPAFAAASGDTGQIAAVVASHFNETDSRSEWSIWNGFLKAFRLDGQGKIPTLTTVATGALQFPDETVPNDATVLARKPVWDAGRVLGYTDPVGNLGEKAPAGLPAAPLSPSAKAPAVRVWPGRKIVWASGSGFPLTRQDFLPDTGTCSGACFDDLMGNMGLTPPTDTTLRTLAERTTQFLRGGITPGSGSRDEVLNLVKPSSVGTIGPSAGQRQKYSFFFQDDIPAPFTPPQVRTDGEAVPKGYPHKLGDIFHSEPLLLDPPRYFQYLSLNLNGYRAFAERHAKRRRVLFVGTNAGFLEAFDAGVWDRDDGGTFDNVFDLGTGREIFAYAPRGIMQGFPNLLDWPPAPKYFVDGPLGTADVFIDPRHNGVPTAVKRVWRSVVVGGLRQGGPHYFALDVTQPDDIDTAPTSPTYGAIVGNKDASPGCLNGGSASCTAGATETARKYPEVLWELTDETIPKMGETWSRPVLGRIRVINSTDAFEDRYVVIFGGGRDATFQPGGTILTADQLVAPFKPATRGRALYIVDVETGQILHKAVSGVDGGGAPVLFAPVPGSPAVADLDDDGYLDVVYVGDVNGRMWKLSLAADLASGRGKLLAGSEIKDFRPFLLYDASKAGTQIQPIYFEPGIVSYGRTKTPVGIAFGTGDRADLAVPNADPTKPNRLHLVIDNGQAETYDEDDLRNITPSGGVSAVGDGPGSDGQGFRLDFQTANEKTVSAAFSTQGFLSVATFTPDLGSPCATSGTSFRYSFFFQKGEEAYNIGSPTGTFTDYRRSLGPGLAALSQGTSARADTIDGAALSSGAIDQREAPGIVRSLPQNWKEP
ncbi:MAG TPA: PilC/PilY family type IV pilus protein, partial [Thermoanaerobaculia bacterium]|nr:PilC/PilY family type IV pilus protein [Thermoanaerobaculia bacterium]